MADPMTATVVLAAANMAMTAMQHHEGPRLRDTKVSTADYGTPLNYVRGIRVVSCPCIFAEDIEQRKRKRKGKGGKQSQYDGFLTGAWHLADHEITKLRKLWFDNHLVYDATGSGEEVFPLDDDYDLGYYMRIYLGTEDQEVDPRMEATVTARRGAGTCSAFKGEAYIFLEEVPVEQIGNRPPQIKAEIEALDDVGPIYPLDEANGPIGGAIQRLVFSSDHSKLLLNSGTGFNIYDVATRTLLSSGLRIWDNYAVLRDSGTLFAMDGNSLKEYDSSGSEIGTFHGFPGGTLSEIYIAWDGNGNEHRLVPATGQSHYDETAYPTHVFRGLFTDLDGNVWAIGGDSTTTARFQRFTTISASAYPASFTVGGLNAVSSNRLGYGAHYRNGGNDRFVFWWGDEVYAVDPNDGTLLDVLDTIDLANPYIAIAPALANFPVGDSSIWFGSEEFSLADFSLIRTIDMTDWLPGAYVDTGTYDPLTNSIVRTADIHTVYFYELDRYEGGMTLEGVLTFLSERAGLEADEYDYSAFADIDVDGYSWTHGDGAAIIEPLLKVYDVQLRPHDFLLQGIRRGGAVGAAIDEGSFAAEQTGYDANDRADRDLPARLVLAFADLDAEHQPNAAVEPAPRGAHVGARDQLIDMSTLALSAGDARQYTARMVRRLFFSRETMPVALPLAHRGLEVGDLRPLTIDGDPVTQCCTRITIGADGVIATEWERDDPRLATLNGASGGAALGYLPSAIYEPAEAVGEVLDLPLLADTHEQATPFVYLVAASADPSKSFIGADFAVSDTGGSGSFTEGWGSVSPELASARGTVTEALPEAEPWIFDRASQVTVTLLAGELASATDDQLRDDPQRNLALIGGELLQFGTATLVAPQVYTLSDFLRGTFGTEAAIAGHATGERFWLLDHTVAIRTIGAGEIGDTDHYIASTPARTPDEADAQALAFTAAAHKPYAPVHGSQVLSGADLVFDAVRRTRIGGASLNGQDVPLGQASESWALDILDTGVVVRTITGTSLPLTYLEADQVTDFGSGQSSVDAMLYQVDPTLNLRGYPLAFSA